METFFSVLSTMLLLFTYILIGYGLKKTRILPEQTDSVLSKLENVALVPAVVISTFLARCNLENIRTHWTLILIGVGVLAVILPCAFVIGRILGTNDFEARIFRYSTVIPNFSFFGIPLIKGAFGEDVLFEYLIFCLPMYLVCYSIGVVWLIPNNKNQKITLKSFYNPICVSLVIGIVLGLLQVPLPAVLQTALSDLSACMGPLAMILTGFVIGGYKVNDLLGDKRIYAMAALRLLIIPVVFTAVLKLFHMEVSTLVIVLAFLAMPLGVNTIVIPAAYDGDTKIGASCALISSFLAVITIPLLFLILIP